MLFLGEVVFDVLTYLNWTLHYFSLQVKFVWPGPVCTVWLGKFSRHNHHSWIFSRH